MDICPGEVYRAFDGSGGVRPFVVVSRPEFNRGSYLLAVPFTTAHLEERRGLPSCVPFTKGTFGLEKACVAQAEALTLLRRSDLTQPMERLGTISGSKLAKLVEAIGHVIGARCEPAA